MKIIFSQPILSKGSKIMHISNHEIKKHEDIFEIAFQSWALQVSWFPQPNIFFSILFDLQVFLMSRHFLIPTRVFFRWRIIKENSFLAFFSIITKNFLFFSLLFFLPMSPNDYLPKTSHLKKESTNGLVGLLWKACWVKIF